MTTKELFDLNLKEIKINKKIKTKYINTLEDIRSLAEYSVFSRISVQ